MCVPLCVSELVCVCVRFINTYAYEARHDGAQWGTRRALFIYM